MTALQSEHPITDRFVPSPLRLASTHLHDLEANVPAQRQCDVVVAVARSGEYMAYAVLVDGERPFVQYVGRCDSASEAGLLAFGEHVANLDSSRSWTVAVSSGKFASSYAEFAASWPHIDLVLAPTNHPVMEQARAEAKRVLSRCAPKAPASAPKPKLSRVLIATDGSSGYQAAKYRGGYGWIDEEGSYGSGTITSITPVDAEVCAIIDAIRSHPASRPLHIVTDSRSAIKVFESARADELKSPVKDLGNGLLSRLKSTIAGRDVTISWVRGHSGHPLNEGADRLSRYARRSRAMGVAASAIDDVRASIAAETMEEWEEHSANLLSSTQD